MSLRSNRWGTFFGACLLGCLTSGCCDECLPDTLFSLPLLPLDVEQEATIELAKSSGGRARVTCTWSSGPEWMCDPAPRETTDEGLRYHFDEAFTWFIRISGPTGTRQFSRSASTDDPGEGTFPTSCPLCYDAELTVDAIDLESVGVEREGPPPPPPPPMFGQSCSTHSECGPGLLCGPIGATSTTCTTTCDTDADCFAGTVCGPGYCAFAP